jgi:hypothetical protein
LKSKNLRAALGAAILLPAFAAQLRACGPDFPNTLLDGGDAALLQSPYASFAGELKRMKFATPPARALPPDNLAYGDQTIATEMADLAAALKRAGVATPLASAIVTEHLRQRMRLEATKHQQVAWEDRFAAWRSHEIESRTRRLPFFVFTEEERRQFREACRVPLIPGPATMPKADGYDAAGRPRFREGGESDKPWVAELLNAELTGVMQGKVSEQEMEAWKQANPRPEFSGDLQCTPGLPREFADYFRGAMAFTSGKDWEARECWQRILALPERERHFKSTWAAYMIARSQEEAAKAAQAQDAGPEAPAAAHWYDPPSPSAEALKYYRQVRELAGAGFADSAGLVVASLGREARILLRQKKYERALELYLDQYAAGDESALNSLHFAAYAVFGEKRASPAQLAALASNPRVRRLLTAYLISRKAGWFDPDDSSEPAVLAQSAPPLQPRVAWLEAVETAGVKDVESASQFALAAYQAGRMDLAQRWIDRAGSEPVAQWVQAKLLMRAGKIDQAAALLARLSRMFPQAWPTAGAPKSLAGNLAVCANDYAYECDEDRKYVPSGQRLQAELGMLRLARREYAEALDALLRSTYWMDAAYVAERVLTADELKTYVDRHWPAASARSKDREFVDRYHYQPPPTTVRDHIRYLLARRLAQEGRYEEARAFYPEQWMVPLDALVAALKSGRDPAVPPAQRAEVLLSAAAITRTNGMELVGTELAPDWFVEDGDFQEGVTWERRQAAGSNAVANVASADELARAAAHHVVPEARWHYRENAWDLKVEAAGQFWEAAKLAPDNSEELTQLLMRGGNILQKVDPEAADKFYKALVRRCGQTAIGQAADRLRWFPPGG